MKTEYKCKLCDEKWVCHHCDRALNTYKHYQAKHLKQLEVIIYAKKYSRGIMLLNGWPIAIEHIIPSGLDADCENYTKKINNQLNNFDEMYAMIKQLEGCVVEAKELMKNQDIPEDWDRLLKRADRLKKKLKAG